MKNFKILDCTLRDGGYYTNWKFDRELVRSLVRSLDSHNVDIIEMGYKSPVKGGEYRKCNDGFISSIIDFDIKAKLAFMIDVKDYVSDGIIDTDLVYDTIKPSSVFKICRIAAKEHELEYLLELISIISNMGYDVICNLMAVTRTSDSGISNYIDTIENLGVKAIYVADSYGALYPENVNQIFSTYPKLTGIHTHDNMGLAFANCISALNNGAEYIDGTLTGMGRGVGNVTTEKLLVHRGDTISNTLLDCIGKFNILKQKYGWGTNTIYHIAGKNHIHPLYMQDLNQSNLTSTHLLSVVNSLKECDKYDSNKLEQYKTQRSVVVIPARYKSSRFPGKPLAKINGKEMVIWVAETAEKAVGVDNVYVATENEEISKAVKKYGYKVILTSDSCLTGTDRVAEASKEIDADIFINVQGDEPMLDPSDIQKVIDEKIKYPNHIVNCMAYLNSYEDVGDKKIPKVITSLDDELIYISRNPIPGTKTGNGSNPKKQVCIYGFNREHLSEFAKMGKKTPLEFEEDIEIIRFLEMGHKVKMVMLDSDSHAVDYPEDIDIVEDLL